MEFSSEEFQRLLSIFREEGSEYLKSLGDGLLHLERDPHDSAILEDIFRNAHNLKGAARILGLTEIASIAHELESIFSLAKDGKMTITPERIDAITESINAINRLLSADVKEEAVNIQKEAEKQPSAKFNRRASDRQSLNTIRVSTEKLDNMMNQVGELLVSKMRLEKRMDDTNLLAALCEGLIKDISRFKRDEIRLKGAKNAVAYINQDRKKCGAIDKISADLARLNDDLIKFTTDFYENQIDLGIVTGGIEESVKNIRMLPLSTIFEAMPKMVRDLSRKLNKKVDLKIEGGSIEIDKRILEGLKDPMVHLLTNCIDHGIEQPDERRRIGKTEEGSINVAAAAVGGYIEITVEDNGKGISIDRIKERVLKKGLVTVDALPALTNEQLINFIFEPGFSTSDIITDISGRGVGMDVVRKNIEELNGLIFVQSEYGKGCKTTIRVPLTLVTVRVILIEISGEVCALPETSIDRILCVKEEAIFTVGDSDIFREGVNILPIGRLHQILGFPKREDEGSKDEYPVIIVESGEKKAAFIVNDIIDEETIILKNLTFPLTKVKNISGAALLGDGRIAIVLSPADIIESLKAVKAAPIKKVKEKEIEKKSVLVVDDSITTRTLEKNILESSGYNVTLAVDGVDAYNKLLEKRFDIIVMDVQMPNMDGFAFTEKARNTQEYGDIPIILLTSLESEVDKRRGIEVGADAYIVKRTFDQSNLIETIRRLI
ncbi:MAG: hybrid sensor histidine kinase/response regulator [Nitrospirae bacterium]|nr:hybrid sensor histidine kinase/response regulator [Nitrospirota bacterium]